jgi:phenylpyruvate tautomerase PptA (4-oxalocrotonate tautomerase family)
MPTLQLKRTVKNMPVMQVHYAEGTLDEHKKAALAQRLTDILLDMEGGAKTTGGRRFATVLFTSVGSSDWWVGGRTDDTYVAPPGKFLVDVTIPEGYMNTTHKSKVHATVNAAIIDTMGHTDDPNEGASVLVTISLASIADTVGLPKNGERFAWVRSYFAAKARQFAAARYPADTGGLLPHRTSANKSSAATQNVQYSGVQPAITEPAAQKKLLRP